MTKQRSVYFLVLTLAFMVSACNGKSASSVHSITSFTPELEQESSSEQIKIPAPKEAYDWGDSINFVNTQPSNFALNQLSEKFKIRTLSSNDIISPPIIFNQRVFILDSKSNVICYSLTQSKRLWIRNVSLSKVDKQYSSGGIAYDSDRLYITNGSRDFIVIDAESGYEILRKRLPDIVKTPSVIHKHMVFVKTISNKLLALDKNTANLLWQNEGLPEVLYGQSIVTPVVHKNQLILSYLSGELVVLDVNTGQETWRINLVDTATNDILPEFAPVNLEYQPIIHDESIYVASNIGYIFKIKIKDGTISWQKPLQDIQSMNKVGNVLIIVNNARYVAALSLETGRIIWSNKLADKSNAKEALRYMYALTPILIDDGLNIITNSGKVYQLNPFDGSVTNIINIEKYAQHFTINSNKFYIVTKRKLIEFE